MSGATAAWLIGVWVAMQSPADRDLSRCSTGEAVRYDAGGEYWTAEELGRWRLKRGRLIERPIAIGDPGHVGQMARLPARNSAIERVDGDAMRLTAADGRVTLFRRCPE